MSGGVNLDNEMVWKNANDHLHLQSLHLHFSHMRPSAEGERMAVDCNCRHKGYVCRFGRAGYGAVFGGAGWFGEAGR